jgi:hypothetical protein
MTATDITAPSPVDAAWRFRRTAALLIAPIGPIAIAILRGVLPYDTTDDPTAIIEKITANPAMDSAVVWLGYVALLTLPLGLLIAGRTAMRAAPVLGTIAATVAWMGFVSLFAGIGIDQLGLAGTQAHVPTSIMVALSGALDAAPATSIPLLVFVPGHILGGILLGIAMWRVIPKWAAIALILSQPLHLVFAVLVPNHALDAIAWCLTGVGFVAAALSYIRAADAHRPMWA